MRVSFRIIQVPKLVELRNILIKSIGIEVVVKKNFEAPNPFYDLIFHLHVICMSFVYAHILSICTRMPFVYHSYAHVSTRMY